MMVVESPILCLSIHSHQFQYVFYTSINKELDEGYQTASEWRRSGGLRRKTIFCGEVSAGASCVAVTFRSFDVFSPTVAPV